MTSQEFLNRIFKYKYTSSEELFYNFSVKFNDTRLPLQTWLHSSFVQKWGQNRTSRCTPNFQFQLQTPKVSFSWPSKRYLSITCQSICLYNRKHLSRVSWEDSLDGIRYSSLCKDVEKRQEAYSLC